MKDASIVNSFKGKALFCMHAITYEFCALNYAYGVRVS